MSLGVMQTINGQGPHMSLLTCWGHIGKGPHMSLGDVLGPMGKGAQLRLGVGMQVIMERLYHSRVYLYESLPRVDLYLEVI